MDTGQALKQMAEVRDCMDVRVKRIFIDPLQMLQEKELKEIAVSLVLMSNREKQTNVISYYGNTVSVFESLWKYEQKRINY